MTVIGRKLKLVLALCSLVFILSLGGSAKIMAEMASGIPEPTLDPLKIPKFENQLIIPPVYVPTVVTDAKGKVVKESYVIDVRQFTEDILPSSMKLPKTTVWGYGGMVRSLKGGAPFYFHNAPGATFEATRGIPVQIKWENKLTGPHLFPVDPTLHWANPNDMPMMPPTPWTKFPGGFSEAQSPVPMVPHLHGGEVASVDDGNPEAWWTADGKKGPQFVTNEYHYPNDQPPTTLWYHDHALGLTRTNVMSGLAGFYLLRDKADKVALKLPYRQYEMPLVIQDRSFNKDGSLFFDSVGVNESVHPYWTPEFFGNTITVNGKAWPNLNVERRQYRFRVLNGSNARFYELQLDKNLPFTQIGSDGGYLEAPVVLNKIVIAPGERVDLLVDFSKFSKGTKIILRNTAAAPYPDGDQPDPKTTGQVMQFTVSGTKAVHPAPLKGKLNKITRLAPPDKTRVLTLNEVMGSEGPFEALLNGQRWSADVSEMPKVGSTEDWKLVNLTEDTHPIHLHLVQFQIVSRQKTNSEGYKKAWIAKNGIAPLNHATIEVDPTPFLTGSSRPPAQNELGWKDTVQTAAGEVTTIRVRFAPQDAVKSVPGVNLFSFDPTKGPGYVWHCHILDHEDNEMMRPLQIKN